jgi:hypothetical protein
MTKLLGIRLLFLHSYNDHPHAPSIFTSPNLSTFEMGGPDRTCEVDPQNTTAFALGLFLIFVGGTLSLRLLEN